MPHLTQGMDGMPLLRTERQRAMMRLQRNDPRHIRLPSIQLGRIVADGQQLARLPVTGVKPAQQWLQQQRIAETTEADDERLERHRHAQTQRSVRTVGLHRKE
jgi:hypothetical protein